MRLHILSDLHLEFAPFTPPDVGADAVILAGDIHNGRQGVVWAFQTFPNHPVIYALGNHEFYGLKLQRVVEEIKDLASGTNIHVLERESFCLEDVVFLGTTLWTDFALNGNHVAAEAAAQAGINDYRQIQTMPLHNQLKPSDTRGLHMRSRQWLEEQVFDLKGRKVVIVTHHAPSRRSIPPRLDGDPFNPAFASDMSRFIIESEARLWVHGHIHCGCDYTLGKTRVVANPRGYPTEPPCGFDPGLIVEV